MKKVAIVDYGMGNINSVFNAFHAVGCSAEITKKPESLRQVDMIVLPGVGAFGDGMRHLRSGDWIDILNDEVKCKGKPFLGICLGMQMLATTGKEHGKHEGLNWVPGIVDRIRSNSPDIRVPHIGWNDVNFIKKEGVYAGLDDSQDFYFVHSFVLIPDDENIISGTFSHGNEYVASVEIDNICAVQFHPEKSHKVGLAVIKNFMEKWG